MNCQYKEYRITSVRDAGKMRREKAEAKDTEAARERAGRQAMQKSTSTDRLFHKGCHPLMNSSWYWEPPEMGVQ